MSVTILTFFRAATSKVAEEKILKMLQAEEAAGGEAAQCVEGSASSRPSLSIKEMAQRGNLRSQ